MLGRTYEKQVCSAARALEIAGERWSLLILRNAAFAGMTRFSEFQKSLGIAPNVLTTRLENFVEKGLMDISKGDSEHLEYQLTQKGLDFKPIIIALTSWGDRWAAPDGAPIRIEHEKCGGHIEQQLHCRACDANVKAKDVVAKKTKAMEVYMKRMGK